MLTRRLDLVIEGTAGAVTEPAQRSSVADACERKYGHHRTDSAATWHGVGDEI